MFNRNRRLAKDFEATIAALIDDLSQRGMLETTMVIALGEFGRTPQINKDAGRDHWSNAMSVLFAGGGTPGGQVVGATDKKGFAAVERVLSPENFASTVYTKLGIDPDKLLYSANGRPSTMTKSAPAACIAATACAVSRGVCRQCSTISPNVLLGTFTPA